METSFSDKKVLVVGLGIQGGGVGLVKFLSTHGAKVTVTDLKKEVELIESINALKQHDITFKLGGHKLKDFLAADIIFKGPSVPWDLPQIVEAEKKGIPVEMEASFFVANCPARIIGITGTRGKSTTATMLYEVLKREGKEVYLAGNIPGSSTISLLNRVTDRSLVILELSSWQLSGFHRKKLSPHVGVFTNLYSDHLNFYKNMHDYLHDKEAIFRYQKEGDYLIANRRLENEIKHHAPAGKVIYFTKDDFPDKLNFLRGDHNLENAAAVLKTCEAVGIDKDKVINSLKNFQGIAYREEVIGQKDNVIFINDTTSTTPMATIKAIEAFSDKPIILILGGNSKNLPYGDLVNKLTSVEKVIFLDGTFTKEILPVIQIQYPEKLGEIFTDLKKAVRAAYELGKGLGREAYVLFSPAATSFSMFKNEFDRGQEFNNSVEYAKVSKK